MKTEEKFILGALVGSALGAAAALIFTPMAGKNLRNKLINGLSKSQSTLKRKSTPHSVAHAKEKGEHVIKKEKAKKKVSR